ncbi:MAG: N-acetyl-alpha-D-glucosaminyl L-malate synthase BshA [Saprospiraceae bacterium]|jgi:N-acetyl-alpha-D-glucosaminyl L-malate synthase BshA|nr:N-acetyl-alpha-D-glucosaminyl L-malate synthase BshA [Saprospiraceae bacterium]MBP6565736.1 N-acetyl-alpha-D-glucosaminyl L-malate synthase BshA [Saprospiraceae bacterium]
MKIGIVCYPTFGGSGVVATELGLGLADKGHDVHFITYKRPVRLTAFHANVYFHEVTSMEYPLFEYTPYETSLASKLVDVVRFEKLDILHVHYAIPHAAVAYMAKQILKSQGINIPIITTLHGTDITLVGTDSSFAPVVEFSINESDGVTAVSEHLRQETMNTFKLKKDIKVIHNFIDFSRFRKTNKDHFRKAIAPEGEKILVHISNFRKVKRVEDVIHIFERVSKRTKSKLLLIGDGPERKYMEELCRNLHLCDEIRFLGKQEAVEELLAIADLFILPSENESFGLAALEAMACEVPVISSNAGGIPEVNIDGVTGYMCEVGDVDGMAARCIELLEDEESLAVFRKNAFKQAQRFDIHEILPSYENYYLEIIKSTKFN